MRERQSITRKDRKEAEAKKKNPSNIDHGKKRRTQVKECRETEG